MINNYDLVCIIDDDPIHLFLTKKNIEIASNPKNILLYKNGKEAFDDLIQIQQSKQKLPKIIFLDINMPIWDGWQFLDEFFKNFKNQDIKIYILTSSIDEEDFNKSKGYIPAINYLIKPISQVMLKNIFY